MVITQQFVKKGCIFLFIASSHVVISFCYNLQATATKKHYYYTIVPFCYSLHGSIDKSCHFRFAKNLSHDQIHLSTLKGEGELKNLELNEEVLTELLELPSWLRLSGATCNRVSVRIQWTKLKSVPIQLSLDEVKRSQMKKTLWSTMIYREFWPFFIGSCGG